jgi:superfamily I DNA and/or RNA helicase
VNTIYNRYKERFITISGRNRSLYLKNIVKKYSYDIGKIMEERAGECDDFYSFLWHKKKTFVLMNCKIANKILAARGLAPANVKKEIAAAVDKEEVVTVKKTKKTTAKSPVEKTNSVLDKELGSLKYLKREAEELEKETGRDELYIGYPFVVGNLTEDIQLRAPLLLFAVNLTIEGDEATLQLDINQPILLNKALALAYTKEKNINADNLMQEFDPHGGDCPQDAYEIIDYLNSKGFKLRANGKKKTLSAYDLPEDYKADGIEIKNCAVLGRFPIANSIYNDYLALEKDNLISPSIENLLKPVNKAVAKKPLKIKRFKKTPQQKTDSFYEIHDLDYAQENALKVISAGEENVVVYGPPGTGKSQIIVNLISDALCKKKRVLVVSQKRAALDVIHNRLGELNCKTMLLPDPDKEKMKFFEVVKKMHAYSSGKDFDEARLRHTKVEHNIRAEINTLQNISDTLFTKTPFGLTLQEKYAASYNIGAESKDYDFYNTLKKSGIIKRNYPELSEDIKLIKDKSLAKLYVSFEKLLEENSAARHILPSVDMHKIKEAQAVIKEVLANPIAPFDTAKYRRSRYLSTFYFEKAAKDRRSIKHVADIVASVEHPTLSKLLNASAFPLLWPAYPFLKMKYEEHKEEILLDLTLAKHAFEQYEEKYIVLNAVLDADGFTAAINGLLNGNVVFVQKLQSALDNYIKIRDLRLALDALSPDVLEILNFAYSKSDKTLKSFEQQIAKVIPIRIYHEIIKNNDYIEQFLSKTVTYEELRKRIIALKADQRELSRTLAMDAFSKDYQDFYETAPDKADFLYEIQKGRALRPVRKMIELFEDYLLRLFPCWLLSPEVVSTILPLRPNLFDLVVFDEASQIFIESAIPAIYRGAKVVVAGDSKQLRPTAGFVKRYFGDDSFNQATLDLSTAAALEVESLLDLATSRYFPVHLTYHYRSKHAELIDFSNAAFYENRLQIAPNNVKHGELTPIKRIMVEGRWVDRSNHQEAEEIVKLVKKILTTREEKETIGIVTFNMEQKEYIEDLFDKECAKSQDFSARFRAEAKRVEYGEDKSLFVKNLENVQGDERDIIIFSIGYAKNESGKVLAQFGSLSMEGGENRLNVAVTRAKKQIYVVTSIEPEELDTDMSKNKGPRLLKNYLQYVRAVSGKDNDEIKRILWALHSEKTLIDPIGHYEAQMKTALEELGYTVDINLGNTKYKLSLAVYDEELKRYVLGVECDYQAYHSSNSTLERDVYRVKFLESRGWKVVRVWSRDWWLSPKKVLGSLVEQVEIEKERIKEKLKKSMYN